VHVVAIDTREPTVRFGAVVAHDRMISAGEPISAMAARTGAVAGVNADYFDIGNTNQPLNVVVRGGRILRTPSTRVALQVGTDNHVAFGGVGFTGSVTDGTSALPLTGVNEWPPQGGAALLTPAFGALTAAPNIEVAALAPLDTLPGAPGTYRVTALGPAQAGPVLGPELGFGPAAQQAGPLPAVGDTVALAFDTQPPAAGLAAAVGGGPLLLAGGVPVDDLHSPAPEERNIRFPVSGAALEPDGTLLLLAVDGRERDVSIGLTRPEFAALMQGFGASDGMAFDSGGSATLVARVLGDDRATVVNTPSDGRERPVADGLFVYSVAPTGANPHLIVRPDTFAALPGAEVPFVAAVVDAAGHRLRGAVVSPLRASDALGPHADVVRESYGTLTAEVPYRTVARVAQLTIAPVRPNPPPGGSIALTLRAADESGVAVALGPDVVWRADGGTLAGSSAAVTFRAGDADATVSATAGGRTVTMVVRVGAHVAALPVFTAAAAARWSFASLPVGAGGALAFPEPDPTAPAPEMDLRYDFTAGERAAYANGTFVLPGEPSVFGIDVFGDGNGAALRGAFVNRLGERQALTLATRVDWQGWRHVGVTLPPDLNPPVTLASLYVVPSLGGPPSRAAGMLRFRNPAVTLPGTR
jgi:hypothetical protein